MAASLPVYEDVQRQDRRHAHVRRIHQLRDTHVDRHTGNHVSLGAIVAILADDVVDHRYQGVLCSEVYVPRQVGQVGDLGAFLLSTRAKAKSKNASSENSNAGGFQRRNRPSPAQDGAGLASCQITASFSFRLWSALDFAQRLLERRGADRDTLQKLVWDNPISFFGPERMDLPESGEAFNPASAEATHSQIRPEVVRSRD